MLVDTTDMHALTQSKNPPKATTDNMDDHSQHSTTNPSYMHGPLPPFTHIRLFLIPKPQPHALTTTSNDPLPIQPVAINLLLVQ
jgi:hypothetical protein